MADPRMMKMLQDMMAKRQAPGGVVPETDDSADMALEMPEGMQEDTDKSYETSPEIQALLKQLGQDQPDASEAEVVPESMDMKKAALEKVKQKYLGR